MHILPIPESQNNILWNMFMIIWFTVNLLKLQQKLQDFICRRSLWILPSFAKL